MRKYAGYKAAKPGLPQEPPEVTEREGNGDRVDAGYSWMTLKPIDSAPKEGSSVCVVRIGCCEPAFSGIGASSMDGRCRRSPP
jgi:hypothetical protein